MYVMYKHNLSLEEGLDFVKANHSKTNPTNNQLLCIKNFITLITLINLYYDFTI